MNEQNNNLNTQVPNNNGNMTNSNQSSLNNSNITIIESSVNNQPISNNEPPTANIQYSNTNNPQQINTTPINTNPNINVSSTPVTPPTVSQVVSVPSIENNDLSEEDTPQGGKLKTILLILFFILLFAFIIFLPNISEYLKNGKNSSSIDTQINNGILTCTTENKTDTTTVSYQMDFKFTNKELLTSTFNITTESEDKNTISGKVNECNILGEIVKDINGIDVSCTNSDNITTTIQSYNYRLINTNGLTKFTEAGGTYPEYKYKENIYDIKAKIIKAGYDCKEKAS